MHHALVTYSERAHPQHVSFYLQYIFYVCDIRTRQRENRCWPGICLSSKQWMDDTLMSDDGSKFINTDKEEDKQKKAAKNKYKRQCKIILFFLLFNSSLLILFNFYLIHGLMDHLRSSSFRPFVSFFRFVRRFVIHLIRLQKKILCLQWHFNLLRHHVVFLDISIRVF